MTSAIFNKHLGKWDGVMEKKDSIEVKVYAVKIESVEPMCCGEYTETTIIHIACSAKEQVHAKATKYIEKQGIRFTYPGIVEITPVEGIPEDTIYL